jgi:hypothetical protein
MDRDRIIKIAREELSNHSMDAFVDNPPSIAQGGHGVVVSGCPGCRKKFQSVNQFVQHLLDDVAPVIADRITDPIDRDDW